MDAVHELLVRYLTDDEFRASFDAEPAAALSAYELSPDEREALLERDERVLGLIGRSLTATEEKHAVAVEPEPKAQETSPTTTPELPPIAVWLSILPHATSEEDRTRLQWQVSLHPEPPGQAEIAERGGVVFRVDVEPCATEYAGQEHVVFRSAIGPDTAPTAGAPRSISWDHDWTTPEAQAAIERVHAAAPADRFEAVLALAQSLELR